MPTKRPATNKPLAGYIRVSRVGDRNERLRSPEWQRERIEAYAKGRGLKVELHEPELDVSGSKAKRPILESILERIDSGELGGIIIYDLRRLSRLSPRDRIDLFERIEGIGAQVLSTSEELDPTTPEGRFQRELFLSLARMEWEKYAANFERAKAYAHDKSIKLGPTPFGYARAADGRLELHPDHAEHMRQAYRLAAVGGAREASKYLRSLELINPESGRPRAFMPSRVRAMLARPVYRGAQVYYGFEPVEGAHPAIVSRPEWEVAQEAHTSKRKPLPRGSYPLTGLAVCGHCGNHMNGWSARGRLGQRIRSYACSARSNAWRGEPCDGVMVNADNLERFARNQLAAELPNRRLREATDESSYERAHTEAEQCRADVAAFLANAPANAPGYQDALSAKLASLEAAEDAERAAAVEVGRSASAITWTSDAILSADADELALMLRAGSVSVEVHRGRGVPLVNRCRLRFD